MDAQLEQARRQLEERRYGEALETLDAVLWAAVGRFEWTTVAVVEHLLTELCPATEGKRRRRCEFLLRAARERLRSDVGSAEEEGELAAADERPAAAPKTVEDLGRRVAHLERQLADLRAAESMNERRLRALAFDVQTVLARSGAAPTARPVEPRRLPRRRHAPRQRPRRRRLLRQSHVPPHSRRAAVRVRSAHRARSTGRSSSARGRSPGRAGS
jgi:hypothetical protein